MKKLNLLAFGVVCLSLVPMTSVQAQITPSHVYQVTETIVTGLDSFHEADFSEPGEISLNLTPRKPRHVLQKAQEVYIKVQTLRTLKGLPANAVEPIPVRDVKPADVKGSVDRILKDLKDLESVYDVDAILEASFQDGKKPTDVYANLAKASASIDGLGIPTTVPNDVHRLAETVIGDLKLIVQNKGLDTNVSFASGASGKSPANVLDEVYSLLSKLKTLTEQGDYNIPGGVVLLNAPDGSITPGHVMDALNNVLAEVGAIKQKVGVTQPTTFANLQSGQTPSNVFDSLKHAGALVDLLIAGGAG